MRVSFFSHLARRLFAIGFIGWVTASTACVDSGPDIVDEGELAEEGEVAFNDASSFYADLYLHNPSKRTLEFTVRLLRDEVEIDCDAVASDPGGRLRERLFGDAAIWTAGPYSNVPLVREEEISNQTDCRAAWVEGKTLRPFIFFWKQGVVPLHLVEGGWFSESEIDEGRIDFDFDDGGLHRGFIEHGGTFSFEPHEGLEEGDAEAESSCSLPAESQRVQWSEDAPSGEVELIAATSGLDDCFALDTRNAEEEEQRWYLCAPFSSFPLAPGTVTIERFEVGAEVGYEGISLRGPAAGGEGSVSLKLARGNHPPPIEGLQLKVKEELSCPVWIEDGCATGARAAYLEGLSDTGEAYLFSVGEAGHRFETMGGGGELWLPYAAERVVLDPLCAEGVDTLGVDFSMAWTEVEMDGEGAG